MKQLTLGELIKSLSRCDKERTVKFDFCYFYPSGTHSYRGYYEQLAIGYSDEATAPEVGDFLEELKGAVGQDYYGYKGGVYTMTENTPVWVDRPRNASGTGVVGVRDNGYQVIIETANID